MTSRLATHARAKLNLTLHVTGRRADGYHTLESLVAFASIGDHLSLDPDQPEGLIVQGPFAQAAGEDHDNLVLKAVRQLRQFKPALRTGLLTLTKYLPAQAGVGGGSADAAATLRLLARLNGYAQHDADLLEAARRVGADVPVCLLSKPVMMRGIGDALGTPLALPKLHAVLVKPPVGGSTPAVFGQLGLAKGETTPHPAHPEPDLASAAALLKQLAGLRNDLQKPALAVAPPIAGVLSALERQAGCHLSRMTGSGSGVLGLFSGASEARTAARILARDHHDWWVKATLVG